MFRRRNGSFWNVTQLYKSNYGSKSTDSITEHNGRVFFTCPNGIFEVKQHEDTPQIYRLIDNEEGDLFRMVTYANDCLYYSLRTNFENIIYEYNLSLKSHIQLSRCPVMQETTKDGHMVSTATFKNPFGFTYDGNGHLFISDGACIRKVTLKNLRVETVATIPSKFPSLFGIAALEDGTIYVCDRNSGVWKCKDGVLSVLPLEANAQPHAIASYRDYLVVTATSGLQRQLQVCNTKTQRMFTKIELATISEPHSIASSKEGHFYVGTINSELFKIENPWYLAKLLWIGHLKESPSYCWLAKLPLELISHITEFI